VCIKSYSERKSRIRGVHHSRRDARSVSSCEVAFGEQYCCEMPVGQTKTVYVFAAKEVKITYDPCGFSRCGVFEMGERRTRPTVRGLFRVGDLRRSKEERARRFTRLRGASGLREPRERLYRGRFS